MKTIKVILLASFCCLVFFQCSKNKSMESTNTDSSRLTTNDGYNKPKGKAGYVLISSLSDEFTGTSLNRNKWLNYQPYWGGREPSQFNPANVSVASGYLRLKSSVARTDMTGNWIWSACVTSNKRNADYGYYEARIKTSNLPMTSSFWFQGSISEIDVAEELGHPAVQAELWREYNMAMNTHYFPNGWDTDQDTPLGYIMATRARDKFHVYAVDWNATRVKFYCDDVLVAAVPNNNHFTELQYMFFDTEVFDWAGLPTMAALNDSAKNTMLVDWVRSYKKN